jgi:rhodanese-related sulfurtransferase
MEAAKEICPTTTMRKVTEGALLVDVRENEEVNELRFNTPNLLQIPLSEFEDRYAEVPKDMEVVMVCKSGGRSLKATYFLMNHGWTNVYNMQHGLIRWVQKDFPTKGNTSSILENKNAGSCCDSSSSSCC